MRTWIARHPDDGRVILTNGMDWCYILVDDLPLRIDHIAYDSGKSRWACSLFDGTVMTGTAEQFRVRADGSLLFCIGTESSERAGMMAKLSLEAVVELSAYLEEDDGNILLQDPEIGRKTKLQRLA